MGNIFNQDFLTKIFSHPNLFQDPYAKYLSCGMPKHVRHDVNLRVIVPLIHQQLIPSAMHIDDLHTWVVLQIFTDLA